MNENKVANIHDICVDNPELAAAVVGDGVLDVPP